MVEKGFTALATIAQTWEDSIQDGIKENESSSEWTSGWATISQTFSGLLQQAWLAPVQLMVRPFFLIIQYELLGNHSISYYNVVGCRYLSLIY